MASSWPGSQSTMTDSGVDDITAELATVNAERRCRQVGVVRWVSFSGCRETGVVRRVSLNRQSALSIELGVAAHPFALTHASSQTDVG